MIANQYKLITKTLNGIYLVCCVGRPNNCIGLYHFAQTSIILSVIVWCCWPKPKPQTRFSSLPPHWPQHGPMTLGNTGNYDVAKKGE